MAPHDSDGDFRRPRASQSGGRRQKIQEPFVPERQIDRDLYDSEGYHPHLLEDWPVEGEFAVDKSKLAYATISTSSGVLIGQKPLLFP